MTTQKELREKKWRLATLTKPIAGKFTQWKQGEAVRAMHVSGGSYVIERLKPKRTGALRVAMPLLNQCCGVPRSALQFQPKEQNEHPHGGN